MFGYYVAITGLFIAVFSLLMVWDSVWLFVTSPDDLLDSDAELTPRERLSCHLCVVGCCLIFWGLAGQLVYTIMR